MGRRPRAGPTALQTCVNGPSTECARARRSTSVHERLAHSAPPSSHRHRAHLPRRAARRGCAARATSLGAAGGGLQRPEEIPGASGPTATVLAAGRGRGGVCCSWVSNQPARSFCSDLYSAYSAPGGAPPTAGGARKRVVSMADLRGHRRSGVVRLGHLATVSAWAASGAAGRGGAAAGRLARARGGGRTEASGRRPLSRVEEGYRGGEGGPRSPKAPWPRPLVAGPVLMARAVPWPPIAAAHFC